MPLPSLTDEWLRDHVTFLYLMNTYTPDNCPLPEQQLRGQLASLGRKLAEAHLRTWRSSLRMSRSQSWRRNGRFAQYLFIERRLAWRWQICANMFHAHFGGDRLKDPRQYVA